MKTYKDYLEKNGYSNKSIPTYLKSTTKFLQWCKEYGTTAEAIDYKAFLDYIQKLKQAGLKPQTIKGYVGNLKIYFEYLIDENYRQDNIVENINIRGVKKEVIKNILTSDELEDLYYSYQTEKGNPLTRKRNKIILGLLVYQGLTVGNLESLQVENIQLYKGKIEVPGTKKSNSRSLELKPWQLMEFMEYLNEIRPQILIQTDRETPQVFLSLGTSNKLNNTLQKISKELKKINNKYINLNQIRTSVIVNWLATNNLRKVQYMAGHKYISSTERYQQDDLESLHETVNLFHPIK